MAQMPTAAALVEPVPIDEEFVSGPAYVECTGGVTYLVFYIDQIQPPELECRRERRICKRLIIPDKGAARLVRMVTTALAGDTPHAIDFGAAANSMPV